MWVQELEIAEKEGRRLRREDESKKVKDEEDAGPSGPPDGNGPAPMDTQMSGLDERQGFFSFIPLTNSHIRIETF